MMNAQLLMDERLVRDGVNILVSNLGYAKATKFIMSIGRGKGDSVKEFHNMWQGKTVEEICLEIEKAKEKGEI